MIPHARIESALTRKEWERVWADATLWEPTTSHVEMAIANAKLPEGDKRKLTRLHAINLQAAATFLETGQVPGPETRSQLARVLRQTAGAIEAILPPPRKGTSTR